MTVSELIDRLEELPQDYPVVVDNQEITEVVVRDEIYCTNEYVYKDGLLVKLL